MNEQIYRKLWVVKFCLKLIYPKFNYYTFLVFLIIKFRIQYRKKLLFGNDKMDSFELKTVPIYIQRALLNQSLENNLQVLMHKCIVISKEQFIQLAAENLFYIDNGVIWLALKLDSDCQRKHAIERRNTKELNIFKHNLHFMTSEIHKKLWPEKTVHSLDSFRIVPVVGSRLVADNMAFTTENEYYNIMSSFELNDWQNIKIKFHPVPSLEQSPQIAAAAEVSLIVNEYDLPNDFIKEILNNQFDLPKLMTENDIFSIELCPKITTKYHHKYSDLIESTGKLYFKCRMLGNKTEKPSDTINNGKLSDKVMQPYFIVKGVTQLTLGENIHALKPKDEFAKVPESSEMMHFLKLCPTGLREKFCQIQETIRPFLTGDILSSAMSSPIIPMLLLTGYIGSGRHLLVKTLAKYNGRKLYIDK